MSRMGSHNSTTTSWCTTTSNSSSTDTLCVTILTYVIPNSSTVRAYDLCILVLTLPFLLYLVFMLHPTVKNLRTSWRNWPLFSILYCLVWAIVILCGLRCVFALLFGHDHDSTKVVHFMWKGARLATEISVVVFGLMFKYYQNQPCKLFATMIGILVFACIFTVAEGILTHYADTTLACYHKGLFIHGGMIFLFVTSTLFAVAYFLTFSLYLLNFHKRWNLPSKKSFYRYAFFLCVVNVFQAVGSMMWFEGANVKQVGHTGICFTMITTVIYFITFPPVIYWIFLRNYFRMAARPPANGNQNPVNVSRSESVSSEGQPRRWRWPLRPTKAIYIRPYSYGVEDSSQLINESNSYGSYSSIGSIRTPIQ